MPGISASLVLMASVNCACVCAVVQVLRSCKVTMGSLSLGSSGPNAMSARPILLTALRTSGNSSMALWVCFSISIDSGRHTGKADDLRSQRAFFQYGDKFTPDTGHEKQACQHHERRADKDGPR